MDGAGKEDSVLNLKSSLLILMILGIGSVIMREDSKEKTRTKEIGLRTWMKVGPEISDHRLLTSLQNHSARTNIGIVETGNTRED